MEIIQATSAQKHPQSINCEQHLPRVCAESNAASVNASHIHFDPKVQFSSGVHWRSSQHCNNECGHTYQRADCDFDVGPPGVE